MRIEYLIAVAVVIYAIGAFARASNRTKADKEKPSWLVRGWNASGAPQVQAKRVLPAVAELAGRALGKATRRTGETVRRRKAGAVKAGDEAAHIAREAATKAGRTVVAAAQRRWQTRGERAPLLWKRIPAVSETPNGTGPGNSTPDKDKPGDTPQNRDAADPGHSGGQATGTGHSASDGTAGGQDSAASDPASADSPATDPAATSTRAPLHLVSNEGNSDMNTATTTAPAAPTAGDLAAYAPEDWRLLAARVGSFHPETDTDLINFMTREVAGICGYAEAYEALHQGCVDGLGLDPNAVQGLGEFAEHVMELTRAMTAAHQRFVTTYEEVMKAVANGVVLPYNGRWMTGEAV